MPINFTQEKRKQKYLLIVVGVVIVITVAILWFGVFRKPSDVPTFGFPTSFVREIKINFDVLENPLLKAFQQFEKASPFNGIKGRSNPFLPY